MFEITSKTTNNAKAKGIISRRSLDGKYELKLRNFSTSDSKGERIKATIEVMRGEVDPVSGDFKKKAITKIKFSIKD